MPLDQISSSVAYGMMNMRANYDSLKTKMWAGDASTPFAFGLAIHPSPLKTNWSTLSEKQTQKGGPIISFPTYFKAVAVVSAVVAAVAAVVSPISPAV